MKIIFMSLMAALAFSSTSHASFDDLYARNLSCTISRSSAKIFISTDKTTVRSVVVNEKDISSSCAITNDEENGLTLKCAIDSRNQLEVGIAYRKSTDELRDLIDAVAATNLDQQSAYLGKLTTTKESGSKVRKVICNDAN